MKITVNGYDFNVKFVSKKHSEIDIRDNNLDFVEVMGSTKVVTGEVFIRNDMNERTTKSTINHELTHVFAFCYGVKLTDEEAVCDFIGAYLETISVLADAVLQEWKRLKG